MEEQSSGLFRGSDTSVDNIEFMIMKLADVLHFGRTERENDNIRSDNYHLRTCMKDRRSSKAASERHSLPASYWADFAQNQTEGFSKK